MVIVALPVGDTRAGTLLRQLRAQDPRIGLVVTGQDADITGTAGALELGAHEYLPDVGRDPKELLSVIGLARGARRNDVQLRYLRKKDASGADWQTVIGRSPAMRKVLAVARQICLRTSSGGSPTILITGETGTGKGLLAKAIHYNSVRRGRPF